MKREQGTMDMGLFCDIINQAKDMKIKRVHLHNYGEPLLDERLAEKISYAKSRGMNVKIFTNASLLKKEKARKILDAGIDEIKISMDGVTKGTFERIRKNLKFEDVIEGIENVIKIKGDRQKPFISLVLVSFDENKKEISFLKKKWNKRVNSVIVTRYHNWAGEKQGKERLLEKIQKNIPCSRLWKTITVLWNGKVALCCLDYDGQIILGDTSKEPLEKIWHSNNYNKVRMLHQNGLQNKIPLCNVCTIGRL